MTNLTYKKVYGSWQEGMYPFFKFRDVVETPAKSIYWWDIDAGYVIGYAVWPQDKGRDLLPLFLIGLEDLEFLVEREEESDLIGYPKVIPMEKIKDLIKPEILDPKECWEWVYVGRQGYEPDACNQKAKVKCIQIEEKPLVESRGHVWLKSDEEPLYLLRKRVDFSKLERFCGRAKRTIEKNLDYIDSRFFNSTVGILGKYFVVCLGTIGLYHYYLEPVESVEAMDKTICSIFFLIVVVFFHHAGLRGFLSRVKKPFRVVVKLAGILFLSSGVSMFSFPAMIQDDKGVFVGLSFVFLASLIIPVCLEKYLNKENSFNN